MKSIFIRQVKNKKNLSVFNILMSNNEELELNENKEEECELVDFDDTHAQIFYSFPFKIEDEYIYQYKVTTIGEEFELEVVKSIKEEIEEEVDEELEEREFHYPEDENSEILVEKIIILPVAEAIGKMRNKIDLRIKDLQTKFTEDDELSDLFDDILENN